MAWYRVVLHFTFYFYFRISTCRQLLWWKTHSALTDNKCIWYGMKQCGKHTQLGLPQTEDCNSRKSSTTISMKFYKFQADQMNELCTGKIWVIKIQPDPKWKIQTSFPQAQWTSMSSNYINPHETEFPLLANAVALAFCRQGKGKPYLISGRNSIVSSLVLI
jgi:hypothetical protein